MSKIPVHLERFDFIASLELWRGKGTPEERRHWTISTNSVMGMPVILCGLSWKTGGRMRLIQKSAPTVYEAVYLALEELHKEPA